MTLSDELHKLPPKAVTVLRFLGSQTDGATIERIMAGTGLSERAVGKAIRRLVTRHFVTMLQTGLYALSERARAEDVLSDALPAEGEATPPEPAAAASAGSRDPVASPPPESLPELPVSPRYERRISAFLPKGLVAQFPTRMRLGVDRPGRGGDALHDPARVIVRVRADNCAVEPGERPLEVPPRGAAGPVDFRFTPAGAGPVHVRVEVFQLVAPGALVAVGGMVFDLAATEFPTPESAAFQTLAATVRLHPGTDGSA